MRKVKLFIWENKEWLTLQEYFSTVLFVCKCLCVLIYLKVSFALHWMILAHPELCDCGNYTPSEWITEKCWSHPAGRVITGTAMDREQILQHDLSLSEEQQCLGENPKLYMTLKRAICQAFHWHKLKWNEVLGSWGHFATGIIHYLTIHRGKRLTIVFACKGWVPAHKAKVAEVIYQK